MKQLDGKVAWVTGAGSGIGRAATVALAEEGASVVLTGRNPDALGATAEMLAPGTASAIEPGDVTDPARMRAIAAAIEARFGGLDIMVNNAGVNIGERRWSDLKPEGIDTLISTNLSSVFYGVMAALPLMRARGGGLFIHVGSRVARFWDGPSGPGYIAAKSALAAMSHTLNTEECVNGIRSTLLNPGETATAILANAIKSGQRAPLTDAELARILKPEDCGDLIRYVACLPKHVCINEVMITPTWNRSLVGMKPPGNP